MLDHWLHGRAAASWYAIIAIGIKTRLSKIVIMRVKIAIPYGGHMEQLANGALSNVA